jgi:drug/metabolite transporter (DMT)-like permease
MHMTIADHGKRGLANPGVQAALVGAVLFGAGTPIAKLLLGSVSPWMLAGLLYLGSGLGLTLYRLVRRAAPVRIPRAQLLPLIGAVFFGGVVGPVLLMVGLAGASASGASLLLNAEGVFTALIAWFIFKENVDRRVALGFLLIVAGTVVVAWPSELSFGAVLPSLAILGACLAWAIDNNLTRIVALTDASWLAATKGLVAGPVNLVLAFALGATLPPVLVVGAAMLVGLGAYGLSLMAFIVALRHIGVARASAYFSVAPFFGAVLAIVLGEPITLALLVGAVLMAAGVLLHLRERHSHEHTHNDGITHTHEHYPDANHRHTH